MVNEKVNDPEDQDEDEEMEITSPVKKQNTHSNLKSSSKETSGKKLNK